MTATTMDRTEQIGSGPIEQAVVAHLCVSPAAEAIEFYGKALGAELLHRMEIPGTSQVMHACLSFGGMLVFLADEFPMLGAPKSPSSLGGTTVGLHLLVEDVDRSFDRAVKAGAKPMMQPEDMFWGDRYAKVQDPFGHQWAFAATRERLTPEEIAERAAEAFKGWPCPGAA